jgi:hypothetical protein
VVLFLGFLAFVGLLAAAAAKRGQPSEVSAPRVEEPAASPASRPASGAGGVTCGYCGGDGRIDEADRYRRTPPRLEAPLGPCPTCAGKGGLSR